MKFLGTVLGCLLICSTAQADFLIDALNGAVQLSQKRKAYSATEPVTAGNAFHAGGNTALARYYANELLNDGALLSITAMSADGAFGKDMRYADSGLDAWVPCQADLYSTKNGVVTLTFGHTCPPKDKRDAGFSVSPADVLQQVEKIGGDKVYCEKNVCQIDYNPKNKR